MLGMYYGFSFFDDCLNVQIFGFNEREEDELVVVRFRNGKFIDCTSSDYLFSFNDAYEKAKELSLLLPVAMKLPIDLKNITYEFGEPSILHFTNGNSPAVFTMKIKNKVIDSFYCEFHKIKVELTDKNLPFSNDCFSFLKNNSKYRLRILLY